MRYIRQIIILALVCLLGTVTLEAASTDDGWYLSTFMGGSMSAPNYLRINLDGMPDQKINATYKNRNFEDSHWWAFRAEKWTGDKGRGIELVHHKIYLANTNDIVQDFSISDGYNLIYYNWGKKKGKNRFRFGAGIVSGHTDITLQGRERFHTKGLSGHFLTGPSIQFNYERYLYETSKHFLSMDTKLTLSYARVGVSSDKDEYAEAPDIALHLSFGVGSKPEALRQKGFKKAEYFVPLIYPYVVGNYVLGTGLTP